MLKKQVEYTDCLMPRFASDNGLDEIAFLKMFPELLENTAELTILPEENTAVDLSAKPISKSQQADLLVYTSAMSAGKFSMQTVNKMFAILEKMTVDYNLILQPNESDYGFCLRVNSAIHSGVHDLDSVHDNSARTMKEFLDNWASGKPNLGVCLAATSVYAYFCLKNGIDLRFTTYTLNSKKHGNDNGHIRFFVQDSLGEWQACEPQYRGLRLAHADKDLTPVVKFGSVRLLLAELMQNRFAQIHTGETPALFLDDPKDKLLMRLRTYLASPGTTSENISQQLHYHQRALTSLVKSFQEIKSEELLQAEVVLKALTHLEALNGLFVEKVSPELAKQIGKEVDLLIDPIKNLIILIQPLVYGNKQQSFMKEAIALLTLLTSIRDAARL